MGDDNLSKTCVICGKKIGWFIKTQLFDGVLCENCASKLGIQDKFHSDIVTVKTAKKAFNDHKTIDLKKLMVEQKKSRKEAKETENANYQKQKQQFLKDGSFKYGKLYLDDKAQKILFDKSLLETFAFYDYSDFTGYKKILIPGTREKHHGIARGITGGIIAGPAGAVVGAVTGGKQYSVVNQLSLELYFKNKDSREIKFLTSSTKTDSFIYRNIYKSFNEVAQKLDEVLKSNQKKSPVQSKPNNQPDKLDSADEIRKFKKLADDGIITQDEFEAKKKQLLGL